MSDRTFRFGVVAGIAPDAETWTNTARRAEELGYSTMLMPDTLRTLAPFPALAAAATATRTLRVGTYVLNLPLHLPGMVAVETGSLDLLTSGRFELGLGAGRPGAEQEAAELGVPFGTPGERVDRVAETIGAVRKRYEQRDGSRPPILVAGAGPRLVRLAAEEADTLALAVPAHLTEDELAAKVGELRASAGARFDELELMVNHAAVGEDIPDWVSQQVGSDVHELVARGGIGVLTGTPDQVADRLLQRRDRTGVSYVGVGAMFAEQLAPVVERLAGR